MEEKVTLGPAEKVKVLQPAQYIHIILPLVDYCSMTVTDNLIDPSSDSDGEIGNSFNQFIMIKNNRIITVDQACGLYRGIVLGISQNDCTDGIFSKYFDLGEVGYETWYEVYWLETETGSRRGRFTA